MECYEIKFNDDEKKLGGKIYAKICEIFFGAKIRKVSVSGWQVIPMQEISDNEAEKIAQLLTTHKR